MQIDRTNTIEVGLYSYKNFVTLNKRQIDSVWEWRNHPDIRKYMYNSDIISYENHLRFLEALFVYANSRPIPELSISGIM